MNQRVYKILEFDKIINILASYAASELGKERCKSLVPSNDIGFIKDSLRTTNDAVLFMENKGTPPLSSVKDIRTSIKRIEIGGVLSFSELLGVRDILTTSRRLKDHSKGGDNFVVNKDIEDDNNIIESMISTLYINKRLEEHIDSCILNDEEMADDASPQLFSIRKQIRDNQASIKEKLNSILHSSDLQKYMQDSLVTIREGRYVIPVKVEYKQYVKGLVHDASSSGQTLFIEPMAVVDANNKIKELKVKEQTEIERILYELSAEVFEVKDELTANMELLVELDFDFSKAKFSIDYKCTNPHINDKHIINIKKGRHPLIDKGKVVPIDLWIGERFDSLIVTGPNTGGKTVTLKTVGLFTLMTQAGLQIPAADGTQMSIFDEVYADIGDEQSIEQSLSTFSSHMKNIVTITNKADSNSLVLVDELGAGTDPTEGAALAMSILECLHQMGATTIATTHYSELKIFAMTTEGFENASCEFNVETLNPTYKLLIGVPGKSNAFAISQRLGLDMNIISRAKEFLTQEDVKFEDLLLDIEKNKAEAEADRAKAESLKNDIEILKKRFDDEKRKYDEKRERQVSKAKIEALEIVTKAKEEADALLIQIREIAEEQKADFDLKKAEQLRNQLATDVNKAEADYSNNPLSAKYKDASKAGNGFEIKDGKPVVEEGMPVTIISLNQNGTVVRKPDKEGNVLVQVGIIKMTIHVSNLKLIKDNETNNQQVTNVRNKYRNNSNINSIKAKEMPIELDIRGFTIIDAEMAIEKYIDDALVTGVHIISIIHGKGTGALRAGVHAYLKKNKYVKSFRLGSIGEGDSGVTIVTLVS